MLWQRGEAVESEADAGSRTQPGHDSFAATHPYDSQAQCPSQLLSSVDAAHSELGVRGLDGRAEAIAHDFVDDAFALTQVRERYSDGTSCH